MAALATFRARAARPALLVLLLPVACDEGLLRPATEQLRSAIAVSYDLSGSPTAAGGEGTAFDQVDRARIRLTRGPALLVDTLLHFSPAGEARLRLEIEPVRDTLTLGLELRRGVDVLFRGSSSVVVQPGEASQVDVELTAVPARLLTADSVGLNALGDTLQLGGTAIFATGDTIGAAATWSTADTAIVALSASGQLIARANGVARAIAELNGASDTVVVRVQQVAALVRFDTTGLRLQPGAARRLTAMVADSNGAAMPHVVPVWSSDQSGVATVDGTGLVSAVRPGRARITAAVGGVSEAVFAIVPMTPLDGALAVGVSHGCVLDATGAAECWGARNNAQLGYGMPPQPTPGPRVQVAGGHSFDRIASHGSHTCGMVADGRTLCWGANAAISLGDATIGFRTLDVPTAWQHGPYRAISPARLSSCALAPDGTAVCWGVNAHGRLGDGTLQERLTPAPVLTSLRFAAIEASWLHGCALTASGAAHCWGAWRGQVNQTLALTPEEVPGGHVFTRLYSGGTHTCGITPAEEAWCWGDNASGQLGQPTAPAGPDPVHVPGGLAWSAIATGTTPNSGGRSHTCGLTVWGSIYCWGLNDRGQLGDGSTVDRTTPVRVLSDEVFVAIGAGDRFTCGLTADRRVLCWGSNFAGELGSGVAGGISTVPVAPHVATDEFAFGVSPHTAFLRTDPQDSTVAALAIRLADLGVGPGENLRLQRRGTFTFSIHGGDPETGAGMHGVFSASATLLDPHQVHRVPHAIAAGTPLVTGPTLLNALERDIPEDFLIIDVTVTVPAGATHLFVAALDSFYGDNADPDADFGVRITVLRSPGLPAAPVIR